MFEGVSLLQGGAAAIVVLTVVLVLTGKLVWHKQLQEVRKDADRRVEQADRETARWRSAFEYSEQARRIDAEHAGKLLEFGHATNRFYSALPVASKGEPDASAPAVEG